MRIEDETLDQMFKAVMERFDRIDRKLDRDNKIDDVLNGDKMLENHDLCKILNVTKRTLQRYRQRKLLPYHLCDDRKCLYKASDVREFLERKRVKPKTEQP